MTTAVEPVSQPATARRKKSKPLLPVRGAASILDKTAEQVLRMVEEGQLAWAWDVALDPERGHTKELRILPACVADYLKGRPCELASEEVLGLLLPEGLTMLASQIMRVLNVSGDHAYHLLDRKKIVACSTRRRGPGGSARVPAKSFIHFLEERRFP